MAKVVKKLFSPLNLIGIIFSIIYSFLYLNGDLTLYDDVNNRNVTLFFYFDNIFPNLMNVGIRGFLIFLVNIPGLISALFQTFLIGQGLIINSIYVFFITELIIRGFRSLSQFEKICSRLSFYTLLLFRPFSIIFWDHHPFFLCLSLFLYVEISNKLIYRYIFYFLFATFEFLLLPFIILCKSKTHNDFLILSIIFIAGIFYAFNNPNMNTISEPSLILSTFAFTILITIILFKIFEIKITLFNPNSFLLIFFSFLFIGSAFYGQNITNRFLLDYIPIMPLLIINRRHIFFNKNSFFISNNKI
tara:strand:- start:1181 stop:2089 length:909 start_codon:yes stop_codon:yes gene_type:complete